MNLKTVAFLVSVSWVTIIACGNDNSTNPQQPDPPPPPPPPPVPTRIVIDPASIMLDAIGQTIQLSASVYDQYGAVMSSAVVSWTSGDDAVATVNTDGDVTAVNNGNTEISARSGGISASVNATVIQSAYSIAVEPQMATLREIDETVQLSVTVLDRNEHPVADVAVFWTSSNTIVASVDDAGLVTALHDGRTLITATYGGVSGTARVNVMIDWKTDRGTLITLYHALHGPGWTQDTNWLSDEPLDAWYGVETDGNGNVTWLYLDFNELSGVVPPEMGNLTSLELLDLSNNKFSRLYGDIPPELGNLTNLQELNLNNTAVEGTLPSELGNLTDLRMLDLGSSDVSGNIPPELGNLTNLQLLYLQQNALSCKIPPELGNLSNLEELNFYSIPELPGSNSQESSSGSTQESCGIPPELGNLTNLFELDLGGKGFSGSIPPELGKLSNLLLLNLMINALDGSIPPELGNLTNLLELDLSYNNFTGNIPPELGNLSDLTHLELSFNENLAGPLPDTFTSLRNLQVLGLTGTGLCAPSDDAFQAWIGGIETEGVMTCEEN